MANLGKIISNESSRLRALQTGRNISAKTGGGNTIGTINQHGHNYIQGKADQRKFLGSFKKGGKVKKSGNYKLHKGEMVIPKKVSDLLDKARKAGAKIPGEK